MSSTSIGRGPASGGNENHDGDPQHTTMGETVQQEPPAGSELVDEAGSDRPPGVEGGRAEPGIGKDPQPLPGSLNVEDSPYESDAARGKLPEP